MVHVQSSWFPLMDRNPQTFSPNINAANAADVRPARMTIFRSAARPSNISFPVLP